MKYRVTFQPMSKGDTRPNDDLDETIESDTGFELLPEVDDYVRIDRESKAGAGPIVGRVSRRLFFYSLLPSGDVCNVNITLEEDCPATGTEG